MNGSMADWERDMVRGIRVAGASAIVSLVTLVSLMVLAKAGSDDALGLLPVPGMCALLFVPWWYAQRTMLRFAREDEAERQR